MTKSQRKWLGLFGASLVGLGVIWYLYERRKRGLSGAAGYVPGRFSEAPAIDGYSDGNMTTTLRAAPNMTIEQRLGSIQAQVEKSVQDPEIRALAGSITNHCPDRDGMCEAKAIYKAVKKRVRYVGDIAPIKMSNGDVDGIDLYQTARRTWEMKMGDCDDQSILIASLLASIGITPKLRVTAETKNGEESHIYPIALLPKFDPSYAVALDTTLPGSNKFGVEAPNGRATDYDA